LFVAVLLAAVGANAEVARAGGIKEGEYAATFKAARAGGGMGCDAWSGKGTFEFSVQVVDSAIALVPREGFPASDAIIMAKQGTTLTGVIADAADDLTYAAVVSLTFKGNKVTGRISRDAPCSMRVSFQGKWKRKPVRYVAKPEPDITRVAITIQGAVIWPIDQNGAPWDGPGISKNDIKQFGSFVVGRFPAGKLPVLGNSIKEFGGDLLSSIATAFDPPDPAGTATVVADGLEAGTVRLEKAQDNFTPRWDVVLPDVSLRGASLVVALADADLVDDDPIATVTLSEDVLRDAAASGGTFSIDTADLSGGMIQRLFIAVTVLP